MLPERIASRIDASGDCWLWTGQIDDDGYGRLVGQLAHRVVYEALVGPIPETLDHLCRVTRCVNPDHLEPVSSRLNILRGFSFAGLNARKSRCKNGHPLTSRGGRRICHQCERAATARCRARRKAA